MNGNYVSQYAKQARKRLYYKIYSKGYRFKGQHSIPISSCLHWWLQGVPVQGPEQNSNIIKITDNW